MAERIRLERDERINKFKIERKTRKGVGHGRQKSVAHGNKLPAMIDTNYSMQKEQITSPKA